MKVLVLDNVSMQYLCFPASKLWPGAVCILFRTALSAPSAYQMRELIDVKMAVQVPTSYYKALECSEIGM